MAVSESAKKIRFAVPSEAERRLIEAAQLDRARFGDVYERYFALVYAYVARRLRSRAETEDLTAEVFRRALASLPRFKWTGAPFGAWLLRIAANLIADSRKREAREGAAPVEQAEPLAATGNPHPAKQPQQTDLEACERRAQLFQLVDGLADDQRRVVVMRFTEEKSIREIAAYLGRSEGAVKQLQFRALQTLRAELGKVMSNE